MTMYIGMKLVLLTLIVVGRDDCSLDRVPGQIYCSKDFSEAWVMEL